MSHVFKAPSGYKRQLQTLRSLIIDHVYLEKKSTPNRLYVLWILDKPINAQHAEKSTSSAEHYNQTDNPNAPFYPIKGAIISEESMQHKVRMSNL